MGLGWCHPAIAPLKPGQLSAKYRCKALGRGMGTRCATAHARCISITLVVNPSEGLGCSYHHLTRILCPRKPSPCGSLWCSPGRRREKEERSQEKGNMLPTILQHGFCRHSLVSHLPGQTRSLKAAIPHRRDPSLEGTASISPGSFQHGLHRFLQSCIALIQSSSQTAPVGWGDLQTERRKVLRELHSTPHLRPLGQVLGQLQPWLTAHQLLCRTQAWSYSPGFGTW